MVKTKSSPVKPVDIRGRKYEVTGFIRPKAKRSPALYIVLTIAIIVAILLVVIL